MPLPEFRPGFRFSFFDALILLAGGFGSCLAWSKEGWVSLVIAFVVLHFFLFCNVFRIARAPELVWAAIFIALAWCTVATGSPPWLVTVCLSLVMTVVLVVIEMRKPSYHGVGWSRVNPNLRQWWDRNVAELS